MTRKQQTIAEQCREVIRHSTRAVYDLRLWNATHPGAIPCDVGRELVRVDIARRILTIILAGARVPRKLMSRLGD